MTNPVDAAKAREGRGSIWRFFIGISYVLIAALTVIGITAIALELYGWHIGSRWRPEDINAIFALNSPTVRALHAAWEDIKYLVQYGAYLIAASAFFIAVTHIKTVAKLVSDFLDARGAIYQLAATMTGAEATARRLTEQADQLSKLEPAISGMKEKLDEAMLKIGDLQRQSVSERSDEQEASAAPEIDNGIGSENAGEDEQNWASLREFWNANGVRLDEAIERIQKRAIRARFSRMDRRNYPSIINGLADGKFISEVARKGSLDLHAIFMSYKPRNRPIPNHVIGDVANIDKILDEEFSHLVTTDEQKQRASPVEKEVQVAAQ